MQQWKQQHIRKIFYRISPNKIDSKKRISNILSDQFEETSNTSATSFSRNEGSLALVVSAPLSTRNNHVLKDEPSYYPTSI